MKIVTTFSCLESLYTREMKENFQAILLKAKLEDKLPSRKGSMMKSIATQININHHLVFP